MNKTKKLVMPKKLVSDIKVWMKDNNVNNYKSWSGNNFFLNVYNTNRDKSKEIPSWFVEMFVFSFFVFRFKEDFVYLASPNFIVNYVGASILVVLASGWLWELLNTMWFKEKVIEYSYENKENYYETDKEVLVDNTL